MRKCHLVCHSPSHTQSNLKTQRPLVGWALGSTKDKTLYNTKFTKDLQILSPTLKEPKASNYTCSFTPPRLGPTWTHLDQPTIMGKGTGSILAHNSLNLKSSHSPCKLTQLSAKRFGQESFGQLQRWKQVK